MKLIELLKEAKTRGLLYCNIPYPCGLDEAIQSIENQLKDDRGFSQNQLTTIEKENFLVFEIRKRPEAKKAFCVKCWK